jgi:hypothetical protein
MTEGELLLPFRQNGLWGYQSKDGRVLIPPRFGWAGLFHEDVARVNVGGAGILDEDVVDGLWGSIDPQGTFCHEPTYDQAGDMREGLAPVNVGARKKYDPHESRPYLTGGRWGYVGSKGLRIGLIFDYAARCCEGLAAIRTGNHHGFIDSSGRQAIAPIFASTRDFSEGLAPVGLNDPAGVRYGLRRSHGRGGHRGSMGGGQSPQRRPGTGLRFTSLSLLLSRSRRRRGRRGAPSIGVAMSFSEGLACASMADVIRSPGGGYATSGPFGFLDRTGDFAIPAQFEYALDFCTGYAPVKQGGRWGYIDRQGAWVIHPQFDRALPPIDDLVAIELAGEVFYLPLPKGGA